MKQEIEKKILEYVRNSREDFVQDIPDLAQSIIDMVVEEVYEELERLKENIINSLKQD